MLIVLSLFLPVLFGMGWCVLQLHPDLIRKPPASHQDATRILALALILGLLTNYALILAFGSLTLCFGIAILMAIAGWARAINAARGVPAALRIGSLRWSAIALLGLLYAFLILFTPVTDWDARSIWFFHGKMIFHNNGTMNALAGWDQPFASFGHNGYPKMAPVLIAQFATAAGYWNEYLPKAGLLALFVPAIIGMAAQIRKFAWSALFLLITGVFSLSGLLWNGYMDGYLALYAGIACLYVCRWLADGQQIDALLGLAGTAMVLSLKNEGMLVALCIATYAAAELLLGRKGPDHKRGVLPVRFWIISGLAFLGPVLWQALKQLWHIPTPMPAKLIDFQLAGERLLDGSGRLILETMLVKADTAKAVGLLACGVIAAKLMRKRVPSIAWGLVLTGGIYFLAMVWVYLTSKYEIAWHLGTSATRTVLPVMQLLFLAAYVTLADIEADNDIQQNPTSPAKSRRNTRS